MWLAIDVPYRKGYIMLILSCKIDEGIMIGDNVRIMIVDIENGKVKIGIEADRSIPVNRDKVYGAKKLGNLHVKT